MKYIGLFLLALAPLSASAITSFSASNGTPFTVIIDEFNTTETEMANRLVIVANFGANGTAQCTWTANATNCLAANLFSVTFTDGDTYPTGGNHFWTITNLTGSGNPFTLSSITFNGVVAGTVNGVAFDRCISASGNFNDNPSSGGSCSTDGTTGSDQGYTVDDAAGGTANITAVAAYTNVLKISSQATQNDIYGVMTLTFGGAQAFNNGKSFTFLADTDLVRGTIPEPGSIALLGSGLLGLGVLARRRRKQ